MITFQKKSLKEYVILNDDEEIITLNLITSSITNKFHLISDFIERLSVKLGKEFDDWFLDFIITYENNNDGRYQYLLSNITNIKKFVDQHIKTSDLDFNQFVDESKVKKSSILFQAIEIEQIIKLSCYFKLYSLISNSENLKLNQRLHKKIYNEIGGDILNSEIVTKIFNIVKTKTFVYNHSDKYMWEYIKMIQCKTIDVHVIEIFNFIMNSILVLCEENKNPIVYFVSVIDESIKWFLRSVYKGTITYEDTISTENIHGLSVNNLRTYCYNDTLGRLKGIAYDKLYKEIEKNTLLTIDSETENSDKDLLDFQDRIHNIEYVSPLCECLVYPILSKMTNISYNHFQTLNPEHSAILSIYIGNILKTVFRNEYKTLFSLLSYYPNCAPSVATTYTIKSVHEFIEVFNQEKFYGFKTIPLAYNTLSYFIGRISRISFRHIMDNSKLSGIPLSKIEIDMIKFFSLFFSDKLNDEFSKMINIMNLDF